MARHHSHPSAHALGRLHRRLLWRRWQALGLRLQLELAALAALVSAFLFWQVRVPLSGLALRQGWPWAAAALAALLMILAALGGMLVGARLAALRRREGPRALWLGWPVPWPALHAFLALEARVPAMCAAFAAPTLLAAGAGVIPAPALGALGALFGAALVAAVKIASAFRLPVALPEPPPAAAPRAVASAPRWRRSPAWLAWWDKDRRIASRAPSLLWRTAGCGLWFASSAAAWLALPASAPRPIAAFLLGLVGFVVFAEWLVLLSGRDPWVLAKTLPVRVRDLWIGRVAWVALGAAVALLPHAALIPPGSKLWLQFLLWLGGFGLGIGVLAVHYGLTLLPRTDVALRVLGLAIALTTIATLLLPPFSGVAALLSAVIHSGRRLRRWHRVEAPE